MKEQAGSRPVDTRIGRTPVFFLHIPKTAGTAVRHFLEAPLRRHEVARVSGSREEYERRRRHPFGPEVKFLSGHVPYWFGEALPSPYQTLLFLRDPVERVMSTYFFWKSLPKPSAGDTSPDADLLRRMEGVDLEEFVFDPAGPGGGSIRNFACRLVGHRQPWSLDSPYDADVLALACKRLQSIELLGVAERMQDSLDLIAKRLGIPYGGALPRQNATKERRAAKDVPASIVRAIRDLNEGDIELWECAQAELDQRMRAAGRSHSVGSAQAAPDHRLSPVMREGRLRLLLGEDPVVGAGWFSAERAHGLSWRFAAARMEPTLHVRLPSDQAFMMVIDSPFAVAGFDYNALRITADGEPVPSFSVTLPDRTLVVAGPLDAAKSAAREIKFDEGGHAGELKSADERDISFAVRAISWLPWSDAPGAAWTALREVIGEMNSSLEAARADKANLVAHAEALRECVKNRDVEIQKLKSDLEKPKIESAEQQAPTSGRVHDLYGTNVAHAAGRAAPQRRA